MQSNKAPKKTRKVANESSVTSKAKKAEAPEMGLANHQHKTGSPAIVEPTSTENTSSLKALTTAVGSTVSPEPAEPAQSAAKPVQHVSREEIAKLAHSYWAARGYAHGSAEADWLRAEEELTSTHRN